MSTAILGPARCTAAEAAAFARANGAPMWFADLAEVFWEICWVLGVRADIAYAQACKETGFGRFGGVIDASFHNTCGLKTREGGANNDPDAHARFPDWRTGIRAHVEHLHLYADRPLDPHVDPRHFPGLAGLAPTVEELSGKWAPSETYHVPLLRNLQEMSSMRRGFVIHHNGPPAQCVGQPHARCERFWAAVKRYHTETRGWSDIAYSFGVCPHGRIFTGRGWSKVQWANGSDEVGEDQGRDKEWYTVLAFVGGGAYGDFDTGSPEEAVTPEMEQGIRGLIHHGRINNRCGDRVLPHNQFKRKVCPGPTLTRFAAQLDNNETTAPQEEDMLAVIIGIYEAHNHNWMKDPGGVEFWEGHGEAHGVKRLINDMLGALYAAAVKAA